jgi:hypothetical protein
MPLDGRKNNASIISMNRNQQKNQLRSTFFARKFQPSPLTSTKEDILFIGQEKVGSKSNKVNNNQTIYKMQSSGKQPSELVNKDIANFISHNSGAAGNEDEMMRLREFKVKVTNNAKKNYTDIINN